jgi:hypothetical protein
MLDEVQCRVQTTTKPTLAAVKQINLEVNGQTRSVHGNSEFSLVPYLSSPVEIIGTPHAIFALMNASVIQGGGIHKSA